MTSPESSPSQPESERSIWNRALRTMMAAFVASGLSVEPTALRAAPATEVVLATEGVEKLIPKPIVFILHGWGAKASAWEGAAQALEAKGFLARSIVIPGDEDFAAMEQLTPNEISTALQQAFDEQLKKAISEGGDPSKVVVIGHSFGGLLAAKLSGRADVTDVVLVAASAYPPGFDDIPVKDIMNRDVVTGRYGEVKAYRYADEKEVEMVPSIETAQSSRARILCIYLKKDDLVPYAVLATYCKKQPGLTREIAELDLPHTPGPDGKIEVALTALQFIRGDFNQSAEAASE